MHSKPLELHLSKKCGWSSREFHLVDWDAHEAAFHKLPRHARIATSKLIYTLANTNIQNHKYYRKSPLCPCCQKMSEIWEHVLSCSSELPTTYRLEALTTLTKMLQNNKTPQQIIDAITDGLHAWQLHLTDPTLRTHAPTAGSLRGSDILLILHNSIPSGGSNCTMVGSVSIGVKPILPIPNQPYPVSPSNGQPASSMLFGPTHTLCGPVKTKSYTGTMIKR